MALDGVGRSPCVEHGVGEKLILLIGVSGRVPNNDRNRCVGGLGRDRSRMEFRENRLPVCSNVCSVVLLNVEARHSSGHGPASRTVLVSKLSEMAVNWSIGMSFFEICALLSRANMFCRACFTAVHAPPGSTQCPADDVLRTYVLVRYCCPNISSSVLQ